MHTPSLKSFTTNEFELTHVLLIGAAALANSKSGSQERWRLSRDLLAQTARNLSKLSDAVERPQQEEHIRSAKILRHLSRAAQIAAEML